MDGLDGDMESDTNCEVTVTCVEALTVPTEAVMVAVPRLLELTIPELPLALLTATTVGEEESHTMDAMGPILLPFESVPVATRFRVVPSIKGSFEGEITMDAS